MCGIAGIINFKGSEISAEELEQMNNAVLHRGPDEGHIKIFNSVGLAHRRLSIIDLANGSQPMSDISGKVWTVFNGEIYNYRNLRKELESDGFQFKSDCDTEIIPSLYLKYGKDILEKINGMFALAVYDSEKKYFFMGRDRMGQKPLFYYNTGRRFLFASELSALKTASDMPSEISPQAFFDYLSLQYVPSPNTIYKNIFKLPPAHFLEIKNINENDPEIQKYWNLSYKNKTSDSFDDSCCSLRELLFDAVEKRLMSDVPYGAFLSGGVDSTVTVGIMSRICDKPVKAFTIGFSEKKYDESNYAKRVVEHLNTEGAQKISHHEKIVSADNFDILKKLVSHYGEPFSDASMLPTFLLSEFTGKNLKVALSGDGADELFAGYQRYQVMKAANFADFFPLAGRSLFSKALSAVLPPKIEERTVTGRIQRLLEIFSSSEERRYFNLVNRFDEKLKKSVLGPFFADTHFSDTNSYFQNILLSSTSENSTEKIMELDLHSYLNGDILTKIDIASMANSLEIRSPFMDHRVVEFAASLPMKYKLKNYRRKHILLETFSDIIPSQIASRGKMGFGVPIASWFRNEWKNHLKENLLNGLAVEKGVINRKNIEKMINEHINLQADNSYSLWALLVFELFLRN